MKGVVDDRLWKMAPAFGVAGGPLVHVLTDEGRARAWSVGAQVRLGPATDALTALYWAGGEALLSVHVAGSARIEPTAIGCRFTQLAWGYLRDLDLVEGAGRDGIRLTAAGRIACDRALAEVESLLGRVREAHPIVGAALDAGHADLVVATVGGGR